ncbi:transposase [bacterium]|nr:transposase [bacterium]
MKKTVYPLRSQIVEEIFSRENRFNKILIVPLDYAKENHAAQFCFATGEFILRKAFTVYNDSKGVTFLIDRIVKICKNHHVKRENVIICCEDPPTYMVNFIHTLKLAGYNFVSVNATEASKYRSNNRASSDSLDLDGIAQAVINRRAMDIRSVDELYTNLKTAGRNRRRLVQNETALKNRIHKCVDILFPGFLNENNTGITPFSPACLWLMEKNFSVIKIRRIPTDSLISGLKRHRICNFAEVFEKLKKYSRTVLVPPAEMVSYYQKSLAAKIKLYRSFLETTHFEENEAVRFLIQSPGFYALSIPGIGAKYATHIIGEYGDPRTWRDTNQMASFAGIVSRQKQTGGENKKEPYNQHLPKDCNKILKDYLLQAAQHTGKSLHPFRKIDPEYEGMHTLQEHFQHVENNEGKSRLRNAKYLLKIIRRLVKEERFYFPEKHWLKEDFSPSSDEHIQFYKCVIESIKGKLKGYDFSGIDDDNNYLLKEEKTVNALIEYRKNNH